jgi:hypothetical protein
MDYNTISRHNITTMSLNPIYHKHCLSLQYSFPLHYTTNRKRTRINRGRRRTRSERGEEEKEGEGKQDEEEKKEGL